MSQTQNHNVLKKVETSFALIDREAKADNWFMGGLLIAIVVLIIFGSFVLLS